VDVVPGGRIEPGESVHDTAIRELLEETGLEIRPLRELGVREQVSWRHPDLRDENHFLHAVPTGPAPDEWVHEDRHCHWLPVLAGMSVYGEHGAFLHALVRKRVIAYVTRGPELLVFEHAGMNQLPAGRIDAHESLEEGLVREVEEETGLRGVRVVRELADAEEVTLQFGPRPHESHAFHAVTDAETPTAWTHNVTGTGSDVGHVYHCRWVPLDECPPLWGKPDPLVEMLRRSIEEE
jgi:8-oxo-dGTP diphosphatase